MVGGEAVIAAGIGCRGNAGPAEIVALLRMAETQAERTATALAAPAFKRAEAGLAAAADMLALPMIWVEDAALAAAQPFCVTRSAITARHTGFASVAEASALAAAGRGARLILPRIASATVTCALAESAVP
jgi:cobalt-precorrin 5A hydrolase